MNELTKENIWAMTENGLLVFSHYCQEMGFKMNDLKHAFRWLRQEEKTPSTYIKKIDDSYIITDFGDDKKGYNCIDFVIRHFNLSFREALIRINNDLQLHLQPIKIIKPQEYYIKFNDYPLSEKLVEWFETKRAISLHTLRRFDVTQSIEKIKCKDLQGELQERNCINFNYFKDNILVNIKFRDAKKNFKMITNAPLVMYGLDIIKNKTECIITEGEIDALSYYEAGYFNVCSVPNGAVKRNEKSEKEFQNSLKYLDNCWQYFENKEKIYIAVDNDDAGKSLCEELGRRLGKHRCYIVQQPNNCKDANETLVKQGIETLLQTIENARPFPIDDVETKETIEDKMNDFFKNGYSTTLKVGFTKFDDMFSFRTDIGEFNVVTGTPGSGKSYFFNFVSVRLAARHGWKIGMFSPEFGDNKYVAISLAQQYLGENLNPNINTSVKDKNLEDVVDFINEHYNFFDIEKDWTPKKIIEKAKELVKQKGIKLLIIDPWSSITHIYRKNETETNYIKRVLDLFTKFTKKYKCHIICVAHTTKLKVDSRGNFEVPNLYQISGSAHWFNKADNGFVATRDFTGKENTNSVYTKKIKQQQFVGKLDVAIFKHEVQTGRFKEHTELNYSIEAPVNFNEYKTHQEYVDDFMNDDEPPF